MDSWQPFAQPISTLVLAGAVVFLGLQQKQAAPGSAGHMSIPRVWNVGISELPPLEFRRGETIAVSGDMDVDVVDVDPISIRDMPYTSVGINGELKVTEGLGGLEVRLVR